jgi:hypothetical protein
LAESGSDCCGGHYFPNLGVTYGNYGQEIGAVGDVMVRVVTLTVTCADIDCPCYGIDPSYFPLCGFFAVLMDSTIVAWVDIPTAVGIYTYTITADGINGTGSIS